jgi:hypothetical protein
MTGMSADTSAVGSGDGWQKRQVVEGKKPALSQNDEREQIDAVMRAE